jgi:hypothetical protein
MLIKLGAIGLVYYPRKAFRTRVISNLNCLSNIEFQMSRATCVNVGRAILVFAAPGTASSSSSFFPPARKTATLAKRFSLIGRGSSNSSLPGQVSYRRNAI